MSFAKAAWRMYRRVAVSSSRSSQPPRPANPRLGKNSKAAKPWAAANSNGSSGHAAAKEVWLPMRNCRLTFIPQSHLRSSLHNGESTLGAGALDVLRSAEGLFHNQPDARDCGQEFRAEGFVPHQRVLTVIQRLFTGLLQQDTVVKSG